MAKMEKRRNAVNEDFPKGSERIAPCVRWFRMCLGMTRKQFAETLKIGRERWGSYEDGRAPLRWEVYRKIGAIYGLNPRWLAVGDAHILAPFDATLLELPINGKTLFFQAFQEHLARKIKGGYTNLPFPSHELQKACETAAATLARFSGLPSAAREGTTAQKWFAPTILRLYAQTKFALQEWEDLKEVGFEEEANATHVTDIENEAGTGKELLTSPPSVDYKDAMPTDIRDWKSLSKRLGTLLSKMGSREKLMEDFDISKQTASAWLSGFRKPDAETTIRLLRWVENGGRD